MLMVITAYTIPKLQWTKLQWDRHCSKFLQFFPANHYFTHVPHASFTDSDVVRDL